MSHTLVIVESPTKAKTIGKFLGRKYVVQASMGHIRDLPEKTLGVDVKEDFEPKYVVSKDKEKTMKQLKSALEGSDRVLLATDEDREGEAISWHLMNALKIKDKDYERIVFHEITKEAIDHAIAHPRKLDMNLVDAQQARRILDRLVGYSLSPFLWKKVRKGLSAGRVQSVAVRLIVEKEREIQNFKPQEYWNFFVELSSPQGKIFRAKLETLGGKKIVVGSEKEAMEIKEKIEPILHYLVTKLDVKEGKKTPPAPFTTSTLQQEASRKFGYGVKQTMMIAQQLYEGIDVGNGAQGLITYMRTDSVNLAQAALEKAREVIIKEYGEPFALSTPRKYKTKAKGAQEAHEAIRPTNLALTPDQVASYLDPKQARLYSLIWKRTIASQMEEAKVENTTIHLSPEGQDIYGFQAKGTVILFPGFMKVYTEDTDVEDEEDEGILPPVAQGDTCIKKKLTSDQQFTKPPARYTEASLVKKLEGEGIGRPSTYAPTISTIMTKGYVEKKEKYLVPTEIAYVVNDLLVEHFPQEVDYKFTSHLEEQFDDISEGKREWKGVVKDFYVPFEKLLKDKQVEVTKVEEKTGEACDKCGHDMVFRFGRFGKFMACSNYPECKNIKKMKEDAEREHELEEKYKDVKCEKCHAHMTVKTGRFGSFLACSNYPECKTTAPIASSTGVECPECHKGELVERKSKRGKLFYSCNKYPACTKAVWNKPYEKPCPQDKGLMLWYRKGEVKCETCNHIEKVEDAEVSSEGEKGGE